MPKTNERTAREDAPPIYLDNVRRSIGARLRATYAHLEGQPLPTDQVDLLLRLRQREREGRRR